MNELKRVFFPTQDARLAVSRRIQPICGVARRKAASAGKPRWPPPLPEDDEHLVICGIGANMEEVTSIEQRLFTPGAAVADLECAEQVLPILTKERHSDVGRFGGFTEEQLKRDRRLRIHFQTVADTPDNAVYQSPSEKRLRAGLADDFGHMVAHDVLSFLLIELPVTDAEGQDLKFGQSMSDRSVLPSTTALNRKNLLSPLEAKVTS
ncbi:hypothetical protein [Bradyrhizobium australafricanum]|uniref:hypothetical protein n=1 Tax=Bradyrhizobium australafricanum TaxID=2821406 RepID=UPI001CE2EAC1|nr:hypothetical protein [Bradyrhizobium australafricanum]MCA6105165.1 hypothetical protein [Bradyrhizobium australafricanum]